MKLFALTAAAMTAASSAFAGSVAYVAPAAPMVVDEPAMGGSGMWIIPAIALILIILAFKSSEREPQEIVEVVGP